MINGFLLPMSISQVEPEIKAIIKREGGWKKTNNKHDRGGVTFAGVTWTLFKSWAKKYNFNIEEYSSYNFETVPQSLIIQCYYDIFYLETNYCHLPNWIRELVVDFAVTSGQGDASMALQIMYNKIAVHLMVKQELKVDGAAGPKTIAAVRSIPFDWVVRARVIYTGCRIQHHAVDVTENIEQIVNLKGWLNRSMHMLENSLGA